MNKQFFPLQNRTIIEELWQLKRQDDHGNQYVMATFNSEEEASKALVLYEGKGHKQTYWIERVAQS